MENPSIVAIMLEAELDYVDQVFLKFPTLSRRILVYNLLYINSELLKKDTRNLRVYFIY